MNEAKSFNELALLSIDHWCKETEKTLSVLDNLDVNLNAEIYLLNQFDVAQKTKPFCDNNAKYFRTLIENGQFRIHEQYVEFVRYYIQGMIDNFANVVFAGEQFKNDKPFIFHILGEVLTSELTSKIGGERLAVYDKWTKSEKKSKVLREYIEKMEKKRTRRISHCVVMFVVSGQIFICK